VLFGRRHDCGGAAFIGMAGGEFKSTARARRVGVPGGVGLVVVPDERAGIRTLSEFFSRPTALWMKSSDVGGEYQDAVGWMCWSAWRDVVGGESGKKVSSRLTDQRFTDKEQTS